MNTKQEIAAKVRSNYNVHICFQVSQMTGEVQGLNANVCSQRKFAEAQASQTPTKLKQFWSSR